MWVPALGQEDPLEKEMATHSSVLAQEIPWTEDPGGYSPWGHKESDTTQLLNNNNKCFGKPAVCYEDKHNPTTVTQPFHSSIFIYPQEMKTQIYRKTCI